MDLIALDAGNDARRCRPKHTPSQEIITKPSSRNDVAA